MRKFIVAGVVAALGAGLLAIPASASFQRHFSVISKTTSQHRVSHNKFRFKDVLLDPLNHQDRVGRDKGVCKFTPHHRLRCRAIARLNGQIGGTGKLAVNGNFGPGDRRLNVVGGTRDFNGVAGKMTLHSLTRRADLIHFDLVR
jgi:hypothetical protein